jgi:hypothetical protein
MAQGLILIRFNDASNFPSVMRERQGGVLTPIGREDWHPRRAPFNAATEANALRKCYSLQPGATSMFAPRRSATSRTDLISASPSTGENTPAATVKRTHEN